MKELLSAPLSSRKIVEYLLLFLLLALVLSAAVYGGYWYGKRQTPSLGEGSSKPLPTRPAVDFYACQSQGDCTSVDAGYCGCSEGGKATAINKKYVNEWSKQWQVEGEPMVFCAQVMSADPTCTMVPRCIERRCQLLEKGEFCGGFAGKPCPAGYHCVYDGHYPDAGGTCQKK